MIVLGGPIGEGDGDNTLLIMDLPSEAAVRDRLAGDPWRDTILEIVSVRPWTVWLRAKVQP